MRTLVASSAAALALAAATQAAETPRPQTPPPKQRPPAAATAERQGKAASYRTPAGHGYSADSRRMADCLASYPNYDPARDRIVEPGGRTRRCEM
jgi:hypothetical protein